MKVVNVVTSFLRKHGDKILLGVGVVGAGASVYLATKTVEKAEEVKEEYDNSSRIIDAELELASLTEEDRKELVVEKRKVVLKTAGEYAKIYAPTVLIFAASVGCILGAYSIVNKKYSAMSAAYTTVSTAFANYRAKVADKYGDEVEEELYSGMKKKVNKKTGEVSYEMVDPNAPSMYAKVFDENNPYWEYTEEYNDVFLNNRTGYLTSKLQARGVITLNDVYTHYGFQPTKEGLVVGWVYKNDGKRDNEIKVTIKKYWPVVNEAPRYILDFNVDGNIYNDLTPEVRNREWFY